MVYNEDYTPPLREAALCHYDPVLWRVPGESSSDVRYPISSVSRKPLVECGTGDVQSVRSRSEWRVHVVVSVTVLEAGNRDSCVGELDERHVQTVSASTNVRVRCVELRSREWGEANLAPGICTVVIRPLGSKRWIEDRYPLVIGVADRGTQESPPGKGRFTST